MLSVVALLQGLPDSGLVRAQVGTVAEKLVPDVYEVEFCDDSGRTYAMASLRAGQLLRLHHEPVHQAACARHGWPQRRAHSRSFAVRFMLFFHKCLAAPSAPPRSLQPAISATIAALR